MPATGAPTLKKRSTGSTSRSQEDDKEKAKRPKPEGGSKEKKKQPAVHKITVKEFYRMEDTLAMQVSQEDGEAQYVEEAEQLRRALSRLADPHTAPAINEEVRTELAMHVMSLRRQNRMANFRNKIARDTVTGERAKVEAQYLRLQNLNHEVEHLRKEVDRCLEFKSADQDVSLVPVDEFLAKAPAEISKPEVTKDDPHQMRLARLNWEMEERKNLVKLLQELEDRKALLASDINTKEQRLESLKPMLQNILDAAKPAQELLNIKVDSESQQSELAGYLPKDLAVLGIQARAFQEISNENDNSDDESAAGKDANGDDDDAEDDGSGLAKRISRKKRRATVSEAVERRRAQALAVHPLSVVLTIDCGADNAKVELSFHSLTELRVIVVRCSLQMGGVNVPKFYTAPGGILYETALLNELFPGDTGLVCPNPVGQAKLDHLRISYESYAAKLGYPYHWAQQLAGIKYSESNIEPRTKSALGKVQLCDFLQTVVELCRARLQSRLSLLGQILSLDSLRLQLPAEISALHPPKILSRLTSWKSMTPDDFKAHPATQAVLKFEMLSNAEAADLDNNSTPTDSCWYYQATIERRLPQKDADGNETARLNCLIRIPSTYPDEMPLVVLVLKWNGTRTANDCEVVKGLEKSVNVDRWKLAPSHLKSCLLSAQLQYLLGRLDILLENGSARIGCLPSIDCSKLHMRRARGPDREMPFVYRSSSNSFAFS